MEKSLLILHLYQPTSLYGQSIMSCLIGETIQKKELNDEKSYLNLMGIFFSLETIGDETIFSQFRAKKKLFSYRLIGQS